jgi:hypothetical protein
MPTIAIIEKFRNEFEEYLAKGPRPAVPQFALAQQN